MRRAGRIAGGSPQSERKKRVDGSGVPEKATLVDLEVSGNPKCLALIRRVIMVCATPSDFSSSFLNDIKLAVTEACTNVIKHAFKYDQSKRFGIAIKMTATSIEIRIIYRDENFNPLEIPVPDLGQIKEGGLGVFIMRNIMDDVSYSVDEETKTISLLLTKTDSHSRDSGGNSENRM